MDGLGGDEAAGGARAEGVTEKQEQGASGGRVEDFVPS